MRRFVLPLLACCLVLGSPRAALRAADAPLAGNWKMILQPPGQEITLCLLEIQDKGGKAEAKILSTALPPFKDAAVEDVTVSADKALHFTLKTEQFSMAVVVHLPKKETKPAKLLGSVEIGEQREFVQLERTDAKELDPQPQKSIVANPAMGDVKTAFQTKDPKKQLAAYQALLEKKDLGPGLTHFLVLRVVGLLAENGGSEADVKAQADKVLKLAASHGPEMERQANQELAHELSSADKFPALALGYARKANDLLAKTDTQGQQLRILKTFLAALKNADKRDEAKEVGARVEKIESALDQEYLKDAMPFKPEKFAGRKGDSERVVLLELFTGAQCPPCVAADVAFDGLLKTYKPTQVVLLQYHLHIPGPDPLTNGDSEARSEYYQIDGTPSLFIDGKAGPQVGGPKQFAQRHYGTLMKALARELETDPEAKLKLSAERNGDQIDIHANVTDLKKPGDKVRLRLVLVEEVVRYAGRNGQRLHHHVVRSFPGGTKGLALKDKSAKHDVKLDLKELSKSLKTYLATTNKTQRFPDADRPLDLKSLMVVAFIQDDSSKEVLEAAQVHLAE
jgi:hypothetical protein